MRKLLKMSSIILIGVGTAIVLIDAGITLIDNLLGDPCDGCNGEPCIHPKCDECNGCCIDPSAVDED